MLNYLELDKKEINFVLSIQWNSLDIFFSQGLFFDFFFSKNMGFIRVINLPTEA